MSATKRKVSAAATAHIDQFPAFKNHISNTMASETGPLFTTDTGPMFDSYLKRLPLEHQQYYDCQCCRSFIRRYGSLVRIADDGTVKSALWDATSDLKSEDISFFQPALKALQAQVERPNAKITGVFVSEKEVLGTPVTDEWTHIAVNNPRPWKHLVDTAHQEMSKRAQMRKTIKTALVKFKLSTANAALLLLNTNQVNSAEKFVGPMQWFIDLHKAVAANRKMAERLIWKATASAPEGFAHIKQSVIGEMMQGILDGKPTNTIISTFNKMVDSRNYQRAKSAPTQATVKQAEVLVEKLGVERSLPRRHAKFAELPEQAFVWRPLPAVKSSNGKGVFGDIRTKDRDTDSSTKSTALNMPGQTMTWVKFAERALPMAEKIEYFIPNRTRFIALTTAVNEDAPPILVWDNMEQRNPYSWYVPYSPPSPSIWNVSSNTWHEVLGIVTLPSIWTEHMPHHSTGNILILKDCFDKNDDGGNGLFPELLRKELYSVRKVIEAYSNSHHVEKHAEQAACGIDVRNQPGVKGYNLRALINGIWVQYHIDRWD